MATDRDTIAHLLPPDATQAEKDLLARLLAGARRRETRILGPTETR